MSLLIDLPPSAERRLISKADSCGELPEALAARLLEDVLESDQWDDVEDVEFLKNSIAAGKEGRVSPANDVFARMTPDGRRK